MPYMVVTLDVSKLTGWLNAVASCRVEGMRWSYVMRGELRRPQRKQYSAQAVFRLGQGAWAERTRKMLCMVVTLDVSKSSGWLNTPAL